MPIYAATIFSGSFLLFLVQPMIGKFILPWFGGTPGVWTVCMLFFQTLLLAGYAYAHWITRWLSPRAQGRLHLTLLVLAVLTLPIAPGAHWKPGPDDEPTLHILVLLSASIGLAYFTLSTTGPLLQHWYSALRGQAPPYRLFALSNLGALLALFAYPFAIEPSVARGPQSTLWSLGMVGFALLCGGCTWQMMRAGAGFGAVAEDPTEEGTARGTRDRVLWLVLPTTASVMLLATTNRLCQEVAATPFLWVVPLAIYLLSFVLCFDHPRWYRRAPFAVFLVVAIAEIDTLVDKEAAMAGRILVQSLALFVVCMICHGELYRLRPHPRHLTAYYLTIASGGALGGVIVALIAPWIFVYYEEFELGLVACAVITLGVYFTDPESSIYGGKPRLAWLCLLVAIGGLSADLLANLGAVRARFQHAERDFYGSLYLMDRPGPGVVLRKLYSGTTEHGSQVRGLEMEARPTTYYGEESGVGLALRYVEREGRQLGAVGLGVGTLAAYARSGDRFRFYELDPRVVDLAEESFTFLKDAAGTVEIVIGDGRLSLEAEPDQGFDLLVLDAFTSDAIPVHLLTAEAFATYLRHLRPDGVIAVHISNRHLDLRPVLLGLGERAGLTLRVVRDDGARDRWWTMPSIWVLMTRNEALLASLAGKSDPIPAEIEAVAWTDEYTSLLRLMR
jgi:hypothetical protein